MESAVPFLDAVEDVSGGNLKIPQSEFLSHGELAVVDQGRGLVAGYTDNRGVAVRTQSPVIVFGDHTRAIKFVDFPFAMGADGVKVLRVKEGFEPKYVYHYLTARAIPSAGYSRHFKFLKELTVPKPPLAEQRRIAAILDQADALRAKRRQVLAHLDALTQSIFRHMFGAVSGSLSLGTLVSEFRYGTSNKSGAVGYRTLRIPNVIGGALYLDEIKTVQVSEPELARLRLIKGDLLFVRSNGNPDNVGRCAVFDPATAGLDDRTIDPWIYASYLIRARLDGAAHPTFVSAFLASPLGRRQLRERSKTSAGQYNINIDGLSSLSVPAVPFAGQELFAARVADIASRRALVGCSLSLADGLISSLQARAFRGEL